ncbi:MAG: hypothetical protein ACYC96_03440 [Fimbriimonadaceae bacterium]
MYDEGFELVGEIDAFEFDAAASAGPVAGELAVSEGPEAGVAAFPAACWLPALYAATAALCSTEARPSSNWLAEYAELLATGAGPVAVGDEFVVVADVGVGNGVVWFFDASCCSKLCMSDAPVAASTLPMFIPMTSEWGS